MAGLILWLSMAVAFSGVLAFFAWFSPRVRAADLRPWSDPSQPNHARALKPPDWTPPTDLAWHEQLLSFAIGTCIAGFCFSGALHTYLSTPVRPSVPQTALGYAHLFKARHGDVYGTYFEYLTVTYGIWLSWGGGIIVGLLAKILKLRSLGGSLAHSLLLFAGSAISMVLYFTIWRISP